MTTILFASPDLWKIVEPWQAIPTETIINGDRAWNIQRGESVPINGEPIRATTLSFIGALPLLNQIQDKVEAHEGPSIAGEATTVYILEDPDFGERMQAIQENLPAFNVLPPEERQKLQEALRGVRTEMQLIVGDETHRVYRLMMRTWGPNQNVEDVSEFDYESPVSIELPD